MMCQTVKNNTFVVFRLGGEDLIIQCLKQRVTPTQTNTADKYIILPLILSSNLNLFVVITRQRVLYVTLMFSPGCGEINVMIKNITLFCLVYHLHQEKESQQSKVTPHDH